MEQQNKPKVSVLMTVYNAGDELRTCLDSIMNQSFQDFEVIAVNNGSTDQSLEILEEYKNKYFEKIFVYSIPHSDFVGTGRNFALSKANGEYIYICDADDIVERDALIFLESRAELYKADVVYGYARFVNMQSRTYFFSGYGKEREVQPGELILSGADYWRRLYKKSLIDKVVKEVGPIPENTNFDDVAWLPVLHSYAEKIRFAERIIYNYFRRTSSAVGGFSRDVIKYSIISENYAMEKCNPKYRAYAELYAAQRTINNLENRWIYSDMIVEHIKDKWSIFSNNELIKKDTNLFLRLSKYNSLPETPMPKIVYLANFDGNLSDSFIDDIKANAFDECEVVILDKSNCSLKDLKKKGIPEEFAKEYYILKNIYENGGVFIDDNIVLDRPLNSLRYHPAFFGYVDKSSFSESIFGAQKGASVIKDIMDTYGNTVYDSNNLSLADRIRNILNVKYQVPLKGETNLFDYSVAVLAPDVICYNPYYGSDVPGFFHVCCHDFCKQKSDNPHLYVTIKNTSIRPLFEKHYSNAIPNNKFEADYSEVLSKKEYYENRVAEIENSAAYKVALKIYALGNKGIFKLFKKLVKKVMLKS